MSLFFPIFANIISLLMCCLPIVEQEGAKSGEADLICIIVAEAKLDPHPFFDRLAPTEFANENLV